MLISHSHKFVFVHIFKTAGTSVRAVFHPYARPVDRFLYGKRPRVLLSRLVGEKYYHRQLIPKLTGFRKHAKAVEAVKYLGEKKYNSYFSFAFVRNPFDWMLSLYFFIQRSKNHPEHLLANQLSFEDFARHQVQKKIPTQSSFLVNEKGESIVTYVGKFETLETDLASICTSLSIPFAGLPHKNVSEKKKGVDFMSFYSEELKNIMTSYFYEDIHNFGY